jgi:hypothetical protein
MEWKQRRRFWPGERVGELDLKREPASGTLDVRLGSKPDIEARPSDVRFTPKSGHCGLFDHLVGECKNVGRNF